MMLTVGQLARRFGISRSTLLYYDRIGLLHPSQRTESNYRLYSERDVERLARISTFRQAGVPLADISTILEAGNAGLSATLEARLGTINERIAGLRHQQRLIAKLLSDDSVLSRTRSLNKRTWVSVLRATGLDEEDMSRWHVEFERLSPEAHRDFLESLGLSEAEVTGIRKRAREESHTWE